MLVLLGLAVHRHPLTPFDDAVRAWVVTHATPAGVAFFTFVSTYGSVTPMIVYAAIALVAFSIHRRSMPPVLGVISSAAAVLAYLGIKSLVLRTRPSGVGNAFEGTYSFPSAHATTSSAVCCTVAYVLWRERALPGVVALLIATLPPFVIGISRVYLDVHWATDVLGGWSLGVVIAALTALVYDSITRSKTDPRDIP